MTHVLITGVGRGIGRALAEAALSRGWQVTGTARGPVEGLAETASGGPEADEDPEDVARGIPDIVARLDMSGSGKFYRWTGQEREF